MDSLSSLDVALATPDSRSRYQTLHYAQLMHYLQLTTGFAAILLTAICPLFPASYSLFQSASRLAQERPVVMMSQNRQSEKDRLTAHNDYVINQKTEVEVKVIMDHLVHQDKMLEKLLEGVDGKK
jgi:hypothetical protein